MGGAATFISGSEGNIEISSSNFHLSPNGNVTMSGEITATAGEIGGWSIGATDLIADNGTVRLDSNGTVISVGSGTDAFASANRIYLDGAGTGSVIYQSDWSANTDGWVGGLVSAENQDGITDGVTTKNNVLRF